MTEFAVWLKDNSTHPFSSQEACFISVEADDAGAALRAVQDMANAQAKTDPDFSAYAEFALPAEFARHAVDAAGAVEIKDANAVFALPARAPCP